jgi:uncharacterized membrane protein
MSYSQLKLVWEEISESFWFLPGLLTLGALILTPLLIFIDLVFQEMIGQLTPTFLISSPESTRGLLSTIATTVATIAAVTFSITIVAIQQASNQYSPRVLQTFRKSYSYQAVLGMFIATFLTSLLVLSTIRVGNPGQEVFIPRLSIFAVMLLTLADLGLLIFFLSQVLRSLQATEIIAEINNEVRKQINNIYPSEIGEEVKESEPPQKIIEKLKGGEEPIYLLAEKPGFIKRVNEELLERASTQAVKWIYIFPQIGDFVGVGDPLAEIDNTKENKKILKLLKEAITISSRKSTKENALFGIHELSDVILKTLPSGDETSPGYCLEFIGDALTQLVNRKFPSNERTLKEKTILVLNNHTWNQFVETGFGRADQELSKSPQLLLIAIRNLGKIRSIAKSNYRKNVILKELGKISRIIQKAPFIQSEKENLLEALEKAKR